MSFISFLRENARWLFGGFLLIFFSSYGQTYFISLSAGHIRDEYGLSNGGFGTLYMVATLASSLTMPRFGRIVDRYPPRTVALMTMPMLAIACVLMALSHSIVLLAVTVYMLRLFGQGMMMQNGLTAIARWFASQRGRALSVTVIGVDAGGALFPLVFVLITASIGWRGSWLLAAASLLVFALPLIVGLTAVERTPRASDPARIQSSVGDWTPRQVRGDPLFYLLLLGVMAPGSVSTTIFFNQVYLVHLRGWSMEVFASTFSLMAAMTVVFAFISGQLIDRFSAVRLLPFFLAPLGAACLVLGNAQAEWSAFLFMALLGVSSGFQNTLFGALWPEIYGTAHLGAVRALTVAFMVLATALGPGLTGVLIDLGVPYPLQISFMGLYCLAACGLMAFISIRLSARALPTKGASATSAP